jgi:N-sulfoglucosamine sulfohydrolase
MTTINRRVALLVLLCAGLSFFADAADRPNVLIVIADDCGYNDLPLFGGQNVKTPRIDRLAESGMTFDNAYLSIAMCNPCRTELYTGFYPARNGSCWNHSAARPGTESIVHHLGDLGYRVGLTGKKHVGPPESFPFEKVLGCELSCVSQTAKFDEKGMKEFMTRSDDGPFCLVVALVVPHSPWTVGNPENFDQKDLKLPPNIADTPETRSDFAKYLAEIEVLDQHVGRTLDALEKTGKADNTIVIFTSEQGSQFPGNKWTNWNTGVHTGFIVRWPGKVKAGGRTGAVIQFADVLPTLIQAVGGDAASGGFDGSSFLPVLKGDTEKHREYAYFMHNNIPEGPPYPIRAVTDGRYHYIRNLAPDAIYIEKHVMGQMKWHAYWPTWVFDTTFSPRTNMLVNRFLHRPAEQFYRVDEDPYEMTNLADGPAYADAKKRLSAELDRWMNDQGDPGAVIDTEEQWQASKQGKHFERH